MKCVDSELCPRVLVIGWGNPLRGDDGVGREVAERLEPGFDDAPCVRVIACHCLLPEMSEPMSRAELAILVDADASLAPGRILCSTLTVPRYVDPSYLHQLSPEGLLFCTRHLFKRSPRTLLFAIGAREFDVAGRLSAPVRRAAGTVACQVRAIVREQLAHAPLYGGPQHA